MPSIGFNSINEIAREQLTQEEILIIDRVSMSDVQAHEDYRIWKHPSTKWYYYMFKNKGRIYCAVNEIQLDYMTTPPTQHPWCCLMPLDEELQQTFRDIMLKYPPDTQIEEGGVLK